MRWHGSTTKRHRIEAQRPETIFMRSRRMIPYEFVRTWAHEFWGMRNPRARRQYMYAKRKKERQLEKRYIRLALSEL